MIVRAALAVFGAAFLGLAAAQTGTSSFPAAHDRLLFTGEGLFGPGVFVVSDTGTNRRQLAIGPDVGFNGYVSVSPDGTSIAYTSTVPFELPPNLPARLRRRFPKLPPSRLAFSDFMFADETSGSVTVTQAGAPIEAYGRPAWSPDGKQLAFAGGKPGELDIYVMGLLPQTTPVDITPGSPGNDQYPSWSSDGRSLAFESNRDGNSEIYVMNPDGSNARNLTQSAARETRPDWSPDSTQLVYSGNATGSDQLYIVPARGGAPTQLTNDPGDNRRAAWSPDGRWIAFSGNRDGQDDVFLVDPQTRQERQLTANASEDLVQGWQPLHDTRAPVVRALPSAGMRGHGMVFRYRVSDDSGRGRVAISFTTPHGGAGFSDGGLRPLHAGVYRFRVPSLDFLHERLPNRFRFCVAASDPSGNSSRSCALFRFVRR